MFRQLLAICLACACATRFARAEPPTVEFPAVPPAPQSAPPDSQPAEPSVTSEPQPLPSLPPQPPPPAGAVPVQRSGSEAALVAPPGYGVSPTADRAAEETTVSHWYGWQILLLDAGGVASLVLAASSGSEGLAWTGAGLYVFGGPIVHGSHGHTGKAFDSLGLRVGLPIGGAFVGAGLASDDGEYSSLAGAVTGFGVGMLAAMLLDAGAVAHEPIEKPRPERAVRVAPTLGISKKSVGAGLVGTF